MMPSFTSDDRFFPVKELGPPASAGALLTRLGITQLAVQDQRRAVTAWLAENRAPERLLRSLARRGLIPMA